MVFLDVEEEVAELAKGLRVGQVERFAKMTATAPSTLAPAAWLHFDGEDRRACGRGFAARCAKQL